MSLRPRSVVPLVLASLVAGGACTRNPYVIGSVCPPAGADAGAGADPRCGAITPPPATGTLVVALDQSGAMALDGLPLASGSLAPALRLRGERATPTAWPPESGPALARGTGTPAPLAGAPFTDGTDAVGLPAAAPAYAATDATLGAVAADDFALEVVLRAAPGASVLAKQAGGTGWALRTSATGALVLDLEDGDATHATAVVSDTLVSGAWYHCLFWVSRAAGGRADCDGSAGALTAPLSLGTLDAPAPLSAGGGAAIRVAHVALFRVAPGGLGAPSGWLDVSRGRFAMLTGVYPTLAGGSKLPAVDQRPSVAYLDLQAVAGGPRALYLVGADWPRIARRTDVRGALVSGYLSEPHRVRAVAASAAAWQPAAVAVTPSATAFPDGEARFWAVAPSTATTTHALSLASTAGAKNQVFSFFVHRLTATRVAASASGAGTAVFPLAPGAKPSQPANVRATVEPWGNDVFRCSYAFDGGPGTQTYTVRLLDDAGNETFAGTGAPTLEVGDLEVDDNFAYAGVPLGADTQPPDHLTFRADDGNLPTGSAGVVQLHVLLPASRRFNDQAIVNVNRGGLYDDQVQLYVRGDPAGEGDVKFWRLEGGAAHWAFDGASSVVDGARHDLTATWDVASARLVIDGVSRGMAAQMSNAQPFGLDRVDVGFSQASSGALEGLVAGLRIGAM